MLRIRRITENNDEQESSSDSDEDYNGGGIIWTRKETSPIDDSKDFSSMSDSMSDLSSSLSECSIMSSESSDNNFEANNQANGFIKSIKPQFNLNDNGSDESVIFAEASNEKIANPTNNKNRSITKKSKKQIKSKIEQEEDFEFTDKDEAISQLNQDRQFIYIQMEFCAGKTLKHLIEKNRINNEELWCLFREILQGLNHIHEQKMIHRDLKPGNILIDEHGHAKIGDFGLATFTKFILQHDVGINSGNTGQMNTGSLSYHGFTPNQSNTNSINDNVKFTNQTESHHSVNLSGAVGTALYVAPELMVTSSKNKYVYNQKVDIYSLGIVFYEMCFSFTTKMERNYVIQNLRQKEILITQNIHSIEDYEKKIILVKMMLNHDPAMRPTTKELLQNELIPRKADEIAFDELLKSSFNNKKSNNYKKILKGMFEQTNSKADEVLYDKENCKLPNSFQYLQIRENVYNCFTKTFQKFGGYLITYPLLMPWNDLCNDFNKAFKLVDLSGTVVTLPFNHRIPFARYLARSGCNNIKRYFIGNVYQINLKEIIDHPKERIEASFDIVTSSHNDCLPEIEILLILKEIINSFPEIALNNNNNYKLVCNHTHLLKAILIHCGVDPKYYKQIFYILSEFTSKSIKSEEPPKENRYIFLKERLLTLDLNENMIEKLLHFLLKTGEPEKILSELRSLTKSETHVNQF